MLFAMDSERQRMKKLCIFLKGRKAEKSQVGFGIGRGNPIYKKSGPEHAAYQWKTACPTLK
jgi:hypothetical protein